MTHETIQKINCLINSRNSAQFYLGKITNHKFPNNLHISISSSIDKSEYLDLRDTTNSSFGPDRFFTNDDRAEIRDLLELKLQKKIRKLTQELEELGYEE